MQLSGLMQNSWSLLKVGKIKIHSYNQLQLKLMLLYSDVWQPQVTIKFIYVIANIFSHHQIVSTFCNQDLNTMHQFMCNHHVQHTKVRSCQTKKSRLTQHQQLCVQHDCNEHRPQLQTSAQQAQLPYLVQHWAERKSWIMSALPDHESTLASCFS